MPPPLPSCQGALILEWIKERGVAESPGFSRGAEQQEAIICISKGPPHPLPQEGRRCEGLPQSPPPRGIPGTARPAFPGPNPPPQPLRAGLAAVPG